MSFRKRTLWPGLAVAALSAATLVNAQGTALNPSLSVESGVLRAPPRGEDGVLAFKGIPYAAPPVGGLRWHAPMPAPKWDGVRDAAAFGPSCLSAWKDDREPGLRRSEDCLTLNVWTGAKVASERRPVMVWLHGGGFQFGTSASPQFGGTQFARKGVVIVSLNYRVGVLGFLAHPVLDQEGPSGDYGLQDQLAALRWVKGNIARFGGDPANVTLFGESAGAHAVGILMASPLSHGLFHKAIGQSGAFWDGPYGPLEDRHDAQARGTAFVQRHAAGSIEALRALPAEQLNAAALWDFSTNPAETAFSPNVDGHVVPIEPPARFARGEQMRIPLLAGWVQDEGYPFAALGLPHRTAGEFRNAARAMFGRKRMAEFLKLYPAATDEQANLSANVLAGDIVIGEQVWQWLEWQRRTAQPVYGYTFTYTSPYTPIAAHITDVPFVFGTLTPQFIIGSRTPSAAADRAFSDRVMSYWVNFAAHGDPNSPGLPHWPKFGAKGTIQDLGQTIGPRANASLARFRFLSSYRKRGLLPAKWSSVVARGQQPDQQESH